MASSSHRKSGSSGRSTQRKRAHVGTGTRSRKASAQPHVQAGVEGKARADIPTPRAQSSSKGSAPRSKGKSRSGSAASLRKVSPKQLERRRRQAEQRRALRLRAAAVIGAVIAVWAAWTGVSGSQLFEIETIEVAGATQLPAQDVIALAAVGEGETLLRLDADGVTERLLADPWIADANLSRRPPSTLLIRVEERVPFAVVDTGVTFWFVDGNGRVIAESVPDTGTVLPVVRDLPDFAAEPGVISDSQILRNAIRVLAGLSEDLAATVRTVSAPSVNETALLTAGSVEIMVGEATRMDEKSALVGDILREQGDRVVFIDVRSVERPISRGLE